MDTRTNPPYSPALPGALACLALTMLLSSLGTSIANVGLPTFMSAFNESFQSVQWVILSYLLAVTTLVVSAGRLGDLFGRRRLMLVGITTFTVASLACAAAPSLWTLIAGRVAQGLGGAVMMALTIALVGEAVLKERVGRAMGLLGTTSAIGTALGPSLGGILIGNFGWQAIFLINVPLGLLAAALAWRFLPRDRTAVAAPGFDVPGTALLVSSLATYSLSLTLGNGHFSKLNVLLAVAALVLGMVFLIVESKSPSPLVRPALFRNHLVSSGFAASGLATAVVMTTLVVGPFYLSSGLHLDSTAIGLVMTTGPLVAALVGVPAGRAVDRFGELRITVAGLLLMAAGAFLLSRVAIGHGITSYVAALVTLTTGFATFQAANNTAVVGGTDPTQRGVVSGLLNLSRNLGLVTGASLMGAVFMHAAGTSSIATAGTVEVVAGMHGVFGFAVLLIALSLGLIIGPQARTVTRFCPRKR